MEADRLFLHKLDDLEARMPNGVSDYEVLGAGGLLRDLLLDGSASLVDQVNRERRVRLRFEIGVESPYERLVLSHGPSLWMLGDGLDPETASPAGRAGTATRDQLLARRIIVGEGSEYTVKDVIQVVANVLGARHLSEGKTREHQALAALDRQLKLGGYSAALAALRPIGRVVLRGLEPLREAVRAGSPSP